MKKLLVVLVGLMLSVSLFAGIRGITKEGYLYTRTKEQLDESFDYMNDKEAYVKFVTSLMNRGDAGLLKGGLKVEIMESSSFATLIRIRMVGDTVSVWTVREAVERTK